MNLSKWWIYLIIFVMGGVIITPIMFLLEYSYGNLQVPERLTLDYQGHKTLIFNKDINWISIVPNGDSGRMMWIVDRDTDVTAYPIPYDIVKQLQEDAARIKRLEPKQKTVERLDMGTRKIFFRREALRLMIETNTALDMYYIHKLIDDLTNDTIPDTTKHNKIDSDMVELYLKQLDN